MKKLLPVIGLFSLLLAGCGHSATDGPYGDKGQAWYLANKDARTAQLAWCQKQDADVQMHSKGCSQAAGAVQQAWLKSGQNYKSAN